jgi:hypothetical protein
MSDFTFSAPKGLIEMHNCECGNGVVYGRERAGQKYYLQNETGRQIKLCDDCDQKAYPPQSMQRLKEVSHMAAQEERIRKEYGIPYDAGFKQWLIDNDARKVTVDNVTKTVINPFNPRVF